MRHSLAPPPDFLFWGTLLQSAGCVSGCWYSVRGRFVICCLAGGQQTRPAPEAAPGDGGLQPQWTSAVKSSILAAESLNGQRSEGQILGLSLIHI